MLNLDEKLKAVASSIWDEIKDIWARGKMFIISILSLFLIVKFRDILVNLAIAGAKRAFKGAEAKNKVLEGQEKAYSAQADALVEKVTQEEQKPQAPVGDDWYKK